MHHQHTPQPDLPPYRHSPEFSIFCVLVLHAAWLLWVEQRAPAASVLSCMLVAAYVLWHAGARGSETVLTQELKRPITAPGAAR